MLHPVDPGACAPTPRRSRRPLVSLVGLLSLFLAGTTRAQEDPVEALASALREALATIERLEARIAALEEGAAPTSDSEADQLEAQLRALIVDDPATQPQRTIFPSASNPRIGVFMDALAEAGNGEEELGDGDRFSLRETEIDFRMPISPFAEGVLVAVHEDAGNNEFESLVEEGYADISWSGLFHNDTALRSRLGRFRVGFGKDNRLHLHDLPQADRNLATQYQLGGEGVIGDGIEFSMPLAHSDSADGLGATTSASLAFVNGELFTGEEGILGERAEDDGLEIDSDAPLIVGRVTHYRELDARSDLEFGASFITNMGSDTITTDAGNEITPRAYGADITWRQRGDETLVGSWLLQGEYLQTDFQATGPANPSFPNTDETNHGFALTAQRQMSMNTYLGVRLDRTDMLASAGEVEGVSPYFSWYPTEFFRVRTQAQYLSMRDDATADDSITRLLFQFTWNFGAHMPHPYWTNL
ncbi:MAG: hypothetical protein DHS20C15_27930 [Planctomycetota bacterium]|nr:MAG: hypothetical protein DHS20C15_27930 [Planctomycetota bacterium]